ncbi:MAG: Mg-dependent DNase [Verrucomicrobiota bacterium]
MSEFFDTHAHLDFPDYAEDLEAVVERAMAAGITRIVTIGTTLEGSARAVAIAERFPSVFAAVGVHPGHMDESPDEIRPALRDLARHPKVVAIGETGLDFFRRPGEPEPEPVADAANRRSPMRPIAANKHPCFSSSWRWPRNWTSTSSSTPATPSRQPWMFFGPTPRG